MDTHVTGAAVKPASAKWVERRWTTRIPERWRRSLLGLTSILVLMAVWAVIAALADRPRVFPSLGAIWEALVRILRGENPLGSSYMHIQATVVRLSIAFIFSFVLGTVIGMAAGRVKRIFDLFDNVAWVFLAVPAVVWAFVLVVAIGIKESVVIGVLMAILTPKVALTIAEGIKALPEDLVVMADAFRVTTRDKVRHIFIPYLVPFLFASARMAFNLGIKLIVVAELVGLNSGIGYMVKYWSDMFQMAPMLAWGMIMIALGFIGEYGIFQVLERRIIKWRS